MSHVVTVAQLQLLVLQQQALRNSGVQCHKAKNALQKKPEITLIIL
jgi:hypothetical protein